MSAGPQVDGLRPVNYAIAYAHRGYRVFPVHWICPDGKCSCRKHDCGSPGKHPIETGWQASATTDEETIVRWWSRYAQANVGIACGKGSNLTVLDVDVPKPGKPSTGDGRDTLHDLQVKHSAIPETPIAITGSGGLHYYFQHQPEIRNEVRFAPGLDTRNEGGFVVGVGSKNEYGGYYWDASARLGDLQLPAKMPDWLVEQIVTTTRSNNGAGVKLPDKIHEGEGRNNALWKVGRGLKAKNLPESAIREGLRAANKSVCKPPLEPREFNKLIANIIRAPDTAEFKADAEADPPEPDEPDMTLVNENRRPAPPFPLDVLSQSARKWVEDTAQACSAPVDFVVAPLFTGASAIIGNTRWASPWAGWCVPPHLWTNRVGLPSSGKTPAAAVVKRLMREVEHGLAREYPDALRAFETEKLAASIEREKWEKETRIRVKDGGEGQPMPANAMPPEPPVRPRLLADDATVEALALMLASQPRGICYEREELAGWFGTFDKYGGHGSDRAVWLETFDGGPKIIDRVKHPIPINVPYLSAAIGGGLQPYRLVVVLAGPDDGLSCRFLYFFADAIEPIRPTRIPDDGPMRSAFARLMALEMTADQNGEPTPVVIRLEDKAANLFQEFRLLNATREREASGLLLSWLGKCPGFVLRLALVLEFLDWAIEQRKPVIAISDDCVRRAIRLIDEYFLPMAERTFGDALLPEVERHAAMIARLIYARRTGKMANGTTIVNRRDLQRLKLPGLRGSAEVGAAVEFLVEAGWLEAIPSRAGGPGGRRKGDYLVNPAVWAITVKENEK